MGEASWASRPLYATLGPVPAPAETPLDRLRWTVLLEAVAVAILPPPPGEFRACHEARRWLASRDRTRLFTYEAICEWWGIDADALRQWVGVRAAPARAGPRRHRR
jgi:hypothetical protein